MIKTEKNHKKASF